MSKERKPDELDTETTFADMNVDGFHWYDPNRKKGKRNKVQLTRKEYWAMVKGAFEAVLPLLGCMILAVSIIILLMTLWLK
jgi:hypothetical protein